MLCGGGRRAGSELGKRTAALLLTLAVCSVHICGASLTPVTEIKPCPISELATKSAICLQCLLADPVKFREKVSILV